MIILSIIGKDLQAKQEGEIDSSKFSKAPSSSRQWPSGFKNPGIMRVSCSFGGKDGHSNVFTIKGLRDRRIRLSVPTAVQLYSLQDKLGLTQPSKVIDWLLDATKHDVDTLPPLQLPPGGFTHSMLNSKEGISFTNDSVDWEDRTEISEPRRCDPDAAGRTKGVEIKGRTRVQKFQNQGGIGEWNRNAQVILLKIFFHLPLINMVPLLVRQTLPCHTHPSTFGSLQTHLYLNLETIVFHPRLNKILIAMIESTCPNLRCFSHRHLNYSSVHLQHHVHPILPVVLMWRVTKYPKLTSSN